MPHRTYNTPKRKCVVKTRLTEDERRAFEDKCSALSISQSEYIRQAIFYSRIAPVIRVTAHSQEIQNPPDTAHARIYDRLLEMCAPVRFTGGNFRRETAQAKLERLKNLMNE